MRLREVVLRVPEGAAAAAYYSELLGGAVDGGGGVLFADGTRVTFEEGQAAYVSSLLEVEGDSGELFDADGLSLRLAGGGVAAPAAGVHATLGHVTFVSPDPLRAEAFYETLGFRLSEALGDFFRWLRCNPVHHTFAFARAETSALHHVAVEVPDRADLVGFCDRLSGLGQRLEYGPGRHMVGGNIFIYFRDRYGIRWEAFTELRREPPDAPPLVHEGVPPERSVNVWGPLPPESFRETIETIRRTDG